jgi:hypothetical protein
MVASILSKEALATFDFGFVPVLVSSADIVQNLLRERT